MGIRRRGRECALQVLYQLEAQAEADASHATPLLPGHKRTPTGKLPLDRDDAQAALLRFFEMFELPVKVREFVEQLVYGVIEQADVLDGHIGAVSPNWRLERMAMVDRNVLRLCGLELMRDRTVPVSVIIDEGIEIARRFGSENSSTFVHGVLDALAKRVRDVHATN